MSSLVVLCNGKGKNETDGSRFDNRAKSVSVINTRGLMVAFGNKMSFVMINGTIGFVFSSKNPFTPNNIGIRWWMDKDPGLIVIESSEFINHGLAPMRKLVCLGKGGRIRKRRIMRCVIGNIVRERT